MAELPRPTEREESHPQSPASAEGGGGSPAQPSLNEISHLFLTGLRERQMGGMALPHRMPPGMRRRPAVSVDVTPEEFAGDFQGGGDSPRPCLSAVLAHHLATTALQRVREYARHVAAKAGRVGLIELGDDGLRLTCFDGSALGELEPAAPPAPVEPVDGRRIEQAIEEMSWDVDRWILFLPGGPRSSQARTLLGHVRHWTLLAAADDAGIVCAYRTLKSVAGLAGATISLAVLDAEDDAQEAIIHRKLAGASRQFLGRSMAAEGPIDLAPQVREQIVLWCRSAGAAASQDHWTAVAELAERSRFDRVEESTEQVDTSSAIEPEILASPVAAIPPAAPAAESVAPAGPVAQSPPAMRITPVESTYVRDAPTRREARGSGAGEVLDLPLTCDAPAILSAVIKQNSQWVVCPVKPPMCAASTVAVDRDGRLHLLACGLDELRAVSRGYGWLNENRALVKMATPQMNIDAAATPQLTLFVDLADVDAKQLAPILQSGHVTIQTYRRLRWGEKTGLLLEAA